MTDQLGLDVQAHGDEAATKLVYGLAKRGEDPRPVFRQIIDELRGLEPEWFGTLGRGTWPALAEVTREAKRKRGQSSDPLIATRKLIDSLTVKRGGDARRTASKRSMRFGTKTYYARFHHTGASVPLRSPLIPVDTKSRRRMVHDVRDYLLGKTKGATS
jgi:hypothetical protein